ncbi:MAG: hypothetical protein RLZZ227_2810 [Pseudomonadota bacterium]|jgi:hypothetical protein
MLRPYPALSARILYITLFSALLLPSANADVVRMDVLNTSLLGDQAGFGTRGAFEQVTGTVHFTVDPTDPHNAIIADLELAPRNTAGEVEFSADIVIWKPVDMARGNGVTLVDIPNRGTQPGLNFNKPAQGNALGDGFLLSEGYTVVWVGWEYDIPTEAGIGIDVPSVPGVDNSAIAGLGLAAVRDVASWIRYSDAAPFNSDYLLSFGLSQSGRFLRNFLYLGFNEDEHGRQVFSGMMPHIAGASRIDLNRRGAEPVSQGQYTATAFPFTDAALPDPVSGAVDGLLDNDRARAMQPGIFYTDTGPEYWGGGRVAALTHVQPDSSADLDLQDNVRLYYLASAQHGPAAFPPDDATTGQLRPNPLDYWWHLRSLLTAMKDWVVDGTAPPPSRHPRIDDGSLVVPAAVTFPAIPGVHSLAELTARTRAANPLLPRNGGEGAPLPLLVPQVDADGNDAAGIRHPELAVPLATYTGWNFMHPERGNPDELVALAGSYIPFAANAEQRRAAGDPRPSIAERYASKDDYLQLVRAAANALVGERYLLMRDVDLIVERAAAHWDLLTTE